MQKPNAFRYCFPAAFLAAVLLALARPAGAQMPDNDLLEFWLVRYGLAGSLDSRHSEEDLRARFAKRHDVTLLAKAQPDEYFCGLTPLGQVPPNPDQPCPSASASQGMAYNKVNQTYIWGMAKNGGHVWFGTGANVACLTKGAYSSSPPTPMISADMACEFGSSWYSSTNVPGGLQLPAGIGDWRPPQIYHYNVVRKTLSEKSLEGEHRQRLQNTLGIRSAGVLGNFAVLAGPSLTADAIHLFAFHACTGAFLGSRTLTEYGNIRHWVAVDGNLYTSVAAAGEGEFAAGGGTVLKWLDDLRHPDYPLAFEAVGNLDGGGADLAFHEGRLFVLTWPSLPEGASLQDSGFSVFDVTQSGLWMSPPVPPGGLTATHADQWTKVWQADDYEPDLLVARTYGGGAIASFGGALIWGTMHLPMTPSAAHMMTYGPPPGPDGMMNLFLGTMRPIHIFRGSKFGAPGGPDIDLLYGLHVLPVYNAALRDWELKANNMGQIPRFGLAGINNAFNGYTWSMAVYEGRLYVGTLDNPMGPMMIEMMGGDIGFDLDTLVHAGGDLFYFVSPYLPATPVTREGFGNYSNYGFRCLAADHAGLYVGTANASNLLTDPTDDKPEGGWEFIEIRRKSLFGLRYAVGRNEPGEER